MPKINVLEKQVAELIAAGEVVERPASIVKELVENSIDAGATAVTIEIQGGGVRYIRVTDNGGGIERGDIANAFLRHATSKVRSQEDLTHIMTMGFRGEALASIAAMCRVEVLTRTKEEVAGTLYVISGGEQERLEDAGCPEGTTITVRDVFFNTPARMKFLKKDLSEGNSVAAVVEKEALANPDIAFRLIRDGETRLQTPGGGQLISAVRCVLGREFAENCIPVHYEVDGLSMDGVISRPVFARGSRSLQNFFINTRFVRSKTCMAALEESYRNALMVGKFPSCVLNLTIPPQAVDVNVHPAKTEVRFADEKSIFNLVYYGCKTALGANQLAPEIKVSDVKFNPFAAHLEKTAPVQQRISAAEYRAISEKAPERPAQLAAALLSRPDGRSLPGKRVDALPCAPAPRPVMGRRVDIEAPPLPTDVDAPVTMESDDATERIYHPPAPPLRIAKQASALEQVLPEPAHDPYEKAALVGELFGTYLVMENKNELLLIDKHAAHERLLFNRLMASGVGRDKQLLLTPVSVRLSPEEHTAVLENLELLSRAGLEAEDFGDGFVIVREVAPILAEADLPGIITEFADRLLHSNNRAIPQQLENLYHTIACRAAIKAHDKTSALSLEQLVTMLREDGDADHCPHGRPVAIRITRYEIEKKFGRLG